MLCQLFVQLYYPTNNGGSFHPIGGEKTTVSGAVSDNEGIARQETVHYIKDTANGSNSYCI